MLRNTTRRATLVGLLSIPSIAHAHSWYNNACCNDKDCHPIDYAPELLGNGDYKLNDGRLVEKRKVKPSHDQGYHLCESGADFANYIYCLYVPLST